MSEPEHKPPPPFPREVEWGYGMKAWCHGFFNGRVDANGNVSTHHAAEPGIVALVEIDNGERRWLEEVGARWLRLKP